MGLTVEQMEGELLLAGWKRRHRWLWASPGGALYLGPAGAWRVMRAEVVVEAERRLEKFVWVGARPPEV
jgi:hypothetical protein